MNRGSSPAHWTPSQHQRGIGWGFCQRSLALSKSWQHSPALTGKISLATGLTPPAIIHVAMHRKLLSPLRAVLTDKCSWQSLAARSCPMFSACCRRNGACLVAPKTSQRQRRSVNLLLRAQRCSPVFLPASPDRRSLFVPLRIERYWDKLLATPTTNCSGRPLPVV
jgi:hypothetical protein